MAIAKRVTPPPHTVELNLTSEEAQVLADVTSCIGGDPFTSRRGLTDAIGKTLNDIGFNCAVEIRDLDNYQSAVWFTRSKEE
jgi:hypothetical protein